MIFTPGVRFISAALLNLVLLLGSILVLHRYAFHSDLIPKWLFYAGITSVIILFTSGQILYTKYKHQREAKALSARLVPKDYGRLPGNLDRIYEMLGYWQRGYPGDGLSDRVQELGPVFDVNILWEPMIFTTCPEHIQIILATDFQNYVKGERFQEGMTSVLGTGVFNSDGEMWKFHRAMTRPFFTRERITHFELFGHHSDRAIQQMKSRLREGYAIDFQDLMGRFTLDSATEFLFGSCVDILSADLPYPHNSRLTTDAQQTSSKTNKALEFAAAFLRAQEMASGRERVGKIWPLWEIWQDNTTEPMKIVNAYVEPIVKEALEKHKERGEKSKKDKDEIAEDETLLDHLVGMTTDPNILKDETLNIMIAGRDTTAGTLTFVIYFLSLYPQVTARLRAEILDKIGPARKPTYDEIKEMKYLRAVINETLRLYPVVPFNIRESINATTWPSPDPNEKPLYIPAKTKVPYSVFMMQRRKDLWGPDAEEFDPDRFLDHRLKQYLTPKPFIFLPFNAGPRICLGQQFAYNEMSFMLIRLLQTFSSFSFDPVACPPEFRPPVEWKSTDGRKAIDKFFPKMSLTMYSGGGLWVRAQEVAEN